MPRHLELVPLGHLPGKCLRRIVKLLEDILCSYLIVANLFLKITAERLKHREDYLTPAYIDGDSVDKVKISVGLTVLLTVEIIEAKNLKKNFVCYPSLGQVIDGIPRLVIFIENIKLEITPFEPS